MIFVESSTLDSNMASLIVISEGQLSIHELALEAELGSKSKFYGIRVYPIMLLYTQGCVMRCCCKWFFFFVLKTRYPVQ